MRMIARYKFVSLTSIFLSRASTAELLVQTVEGKGSISATDINLSSKGPSGAIHPIFSAKLFQMTLVKIFYHIH